MSEPETASIHETYGNFPSAELDLLDEGDKARLRIREVEKASIYLTVDELTWLIDRALLLREQLRGRQEKS